MKPWTDIREWIAEEDRLIAKGFDSITVYTGEEGTGKSYAMLVRHLLCDKTFFTKKDDWSPTWQPESPTDRVVFTEDDFMRLAVKLPPGSALQLDEADADARGAMTKKRRRFLKFLKERRSLRVRLGIGYPHISHVDKNILRSRVRYRAHQPVRGLLIVKVRQVVREDVDRLGNPVPIIRWPVRGRFTIPDFTGHPIAAAYDLKKESFTHRDDDIEPLEVAEAVQPRLIDREAAMPVIERIKAALGPMPVNQAFYSQVLDDIKTAQ